MGLKGFNQTNHYQLTRNGCLVLSILAWLLIFHYIAALRLLSTGYALNLHESIVQYAKELFSGFRDDRELVQHYKGILAACLLESFDKFSKEGRQVCRLNYISWIITFFPSTDFAF